MYYFLTLDLNRRRKKAENVTKMKKKTVGKTETPIRAKKRKRRKREVNAHDTPRHEKAEKTHTDAHVRTHT